MSAVYRLVVWTLAALLSAWVVMLLLPYVTGGVFTPGYWQVFWAEYIIGSVAGLTTLNVLGVVDEYDNARLN